jgi:hypothetical protein
MFLSVAERSIKKQDIKACSIITLVIISIWKQINRIETADISNTKYLSYDLKFKGLSSESVYTKNNK